MIDINEFLEILKIKPDELGLTQLDDEIARLKALQLDEENSQHRNQFLQSLEDLRQTICEGFVNLLSPHCKFKILPNGDIHVLSPRTNVHEVKLKALDSSIAEVLRDTTNTLAKLSYKPENAEQEYYQLTTYGKKYETVCRQHPRFKNFWVGIASVALTGIGFILGAAVGAVCGFLKGLTYCLVGSLFTTPYYTLKTAVSFAMEGNEIGKRLASDTPYNSTARNLLFQGPAIESVAVHVANQGAGFFKTLKQIPQPAEPAPKQNPQPPEHTTSESRLYPDLSGYQINLSRKC